MSNKTIFIAYSEILTLECIKAFAVTFLFFRHTNALRLLTGKHIGNQIGI